MNEKSSKDFHVDDVDDMHESGTAKSTGTRRSGDTGTGKADKRVVRFRYRPRRQTSNKTTLLVGGAALVFVLILLLKFF
jgi:hypothetical protein